VSASALGDQASRHRAYAAWKPVPRLGRFRSLSPGPNSNCMVMRRN